MFEMIPEWAQNQAAQREQQNPTVMPSQAPQDGGTNLAGIFGGGPSGNSGMSGAMSGAIPQGAVAGTGLAGIGRLLQQMNNAPPAQSGGGGNFASILGPQQPSSGMMGATGQSPSQSAGYLAAMSAPPRNGQGNTALQDIHQALMLGRPISDASWAQAGFGPGGTATNGSQTPAGGVYPISGRPNQISIAPFSTLPQASSSGGGPDNTASQVMQGIMTAAQIAALFA